MPQQRGQYYTAKEAQGKLGLNKARFYKLVRQGLIPRLVLPGMKQHRYPKRDVDALALSMNMQPPAFEFSSSSLADQVEEMKIATKSFDHNFVFPLNERINFQQKCKFTYHSLKVRGVVVGYIAMFRLKESVLDDLLAGRKVIREIKVGDILPFARLESFDIYLQVIAIKPDLSPHLRRLYSGIMLHHFVGLILYLFTSHYHMRNIYTLAYSKEWERLIERLGFYPVPGKSLVADQQVFVCHIDVLYLENMQKKYNYNLRHK